MDPPESELFCVTGHDRGALVTEGIERLQENLALAGAAPSKHELARLATASQRHDARAHRLAIVANSAQDLAHKLRLAKNKLGDARRTRLRLPGGVYYGVRGPAPVTTTTTATTTATATALMFPGQGSQFARMLQALRTVHPGTRRWFEALDESYARAGVDAPSRLLHAPGTGRDVARDVDPAQRDVLERELLGMERGAQLGLVASLAMYDILSAWRLEIDVMVGHSNGEHAALIAAGAIPLVGRQAVCDSLCRGGLLLAAIPRPAEARAAVASSNVDRALLDALLQRFSGQLFLAMENCPNQSVIAGLETAVAAATRELTAARGFALPLGFDRAYHTPLFQESAEALRRHYDDLPTAVPHTTVFSCATGRAFPADAGTVKRWMAEQWVSTVRFRDTIETLYERGIRVFVEVGPDNKLCGFVSDTLRGKPHLAVSASSRNRDDRSQLQHLMAELYAYGVPLPAVAFEQLRRLDNDAQPAAQETMPTMPTMPAAPARPVSVHPAPTPTPMPAAPARPVSVHPAPTLAASITRAHHDLLEQARASQARVHRRVQQYAAPGRESPSGLPSARPSGPSVRPSGPSAHPFGPGNLAPEPDACPLLGADVRRDPDGHIVGAHLHRGRERFFIDHSFGRQVSARRPELFPLPVIPFTVSLELLAEAAGQELPGVVTRMTDIRAHHWLAMDHGSLDIAVSTRAPASHTAGVSSIHAQLLQVTDQGSQLAFEATVHAAGRHARIDPRRAPSERGDHPATEPVRTWSVADFYERFAFHGPSFQGLRRVLSVTRDSIQAELVVTRSQTHDAHLHMDPALLDCTGQLVAFWLLEQGERDFGIFPFAAEALHLHGPLPPVGSRLVCHARITRLGRDITTASFDITDAHGRPWARLDGLQQRFIRFPGALAELLVKPVTDVFVSASDNIGDSPGDNIDDSDGHGDGHGPACSLDIDSWALLHAYGGIWERALAHLALTPREMQLWREHLDSAQRVPWLLRRIAAKDVMRRGAATTAGQGLAYADIETIGTTGTADHGPENILVRVAEQPAWHVRVRQQASRIIATRIHDPHPTP